jgi:hypothetical protein
MPVNTNFRTDEPELMDDFLLEGIELWMLIKLPNKSTSGETN